MKIENDNLDKIDKILKAEFDQYDGTYILIFGGNDEKIQALTRNADGRFAIAARNYLNMVFLEPSYYGE